MALINRLWPFGRAAALPTDYTRLVSQALHAAASDNLPHANPALGGGVGASATAIGHTMAGGVVRGASPAVTSAITPQILFYLGSRYPSHGEASLLIDVTSTEIVLRPVDIIDHRGGRFRTQRVSGDTTIERVVELAEMVHVVYEPTTDPNVGSPPWARVPHVAQASVNLERSEAHEGRTPMGQSVSTVGDGSGAARDEQRAGMLTDLNTAQGDIVGLPAQSDRSVLAPPGTSLPPASREGRITRYGPEFTNQHDRIAIQQSAMVAAACGLPPGMLAGNVSPAALREAHRGLFEITVSPLARMVEHALRRGLNAPALTLTFPGMLDLERRTRAAGRLAGLEDLSTPQALAIVGLELPGV